MQPPATHPGTPDGLTIEEVTAIYFDEKALRAQPEPLYRIDGKGNRYYYRLDGEGRPEFFVSVTSLVDRTTPMGYGLIEWFKKNGERSDDVRDERAAYGTFMHIQWADYLINGEYDLAELPRRIEWAQAAEGLSEDWLQDAQKDMLSFAAFVAEKNVTPLAIEITLAGSDGYAGTLDLVCELDFNRKRVRAIADWKSGRKGFYEEHECQLEGYRLLWNENFPDLPADMLFNFAPTDWRKEPTYKLFNQTGKAKSLWPTLVAQWKARGDKSPPDALRVHGVLRRGSDLSENYRVLSIEEAIRERQTREEVTA